MNTKFDDMSVEDALAYCYKHEKQYKSDLYASGEDGDELFSCLISIIDEGTISPSELPSYGMDYERRVD